MKYIDLTYTFTHGMPVYPGDPIPELKQIAFHETDGYADYHIATGMHVGTHMDAPLHMVPNGKRLSEYAPERFFCTGHLIDARGTTVRASLLDGRKISEGDAVLLLTGHGRTFGTSAYYDVYPEISMEFAAALVDLGVSWVGMDTPSPDRPPFAIHKLLLGNNVLIVENLTNLEALLPHAPCTIVALPAKFDCEAAPVRVVAQIRSLPTAKGRIGRNIIVTTK